MLDKLYELLVNHADLVGGVLALALAWFDMRDRFNKWMEHSREKYLATKKWAKSKDLYKAARTAYGVVSKISRKTNNTLDDKAARGLEVALNYMEKLGWDKSDLGNGEKDVILKLFDALHEEEHLNLESSHGVPVSNKSSGTGQIAAPLEVEK